MLAGVLGWAAWMKFFQPLKALAAKYPWMGQAPVAFLKFTGFVDLLGALGLILPGLLGIRPQLTCYAAIGVMLLMVAASIFHIVRGEAQVIGFNIVCFFVAGFIAWGRA